MPISAARAAAFDILMRIETTDAYSSELLHSARFAKLSPADHGLLTELVMGVLRWRGALDDRITGHRRPLPGRTGPPAISVNQPSAGRAPGRLDLEVLTALRLGAYQLLFLDRVPRHAAVSESVELVKRARKSSAAGLVNAVLRKVHRGDFRPDCRSAHPHWLVERWEQTYGADVASRICMRNQSVPETVVHICRSHRQPDVGTAAPAYPRTAGPAHKRRAALDGEPAAGVPARNWLAAEGIRLEPGKLLAHAAIVTAGDIFRASAFREQRLVIQDEASQLVALLVGAGQDILDCCAAPGGKGRILAERNPGSTVVAMDLHPHRAKLLKKIAGAPNLRVVAADARTMPFRKQFHRILVDVPCSGTGTLARNPEIKWRLAPEVLTRLQAYQLEILRAALQQLSPAGRLIYSTCSLEPEENEHVIEKALAQTSSFRLLNCRDELQRLQEEGELVWDNIESLASGPYLRTIPGVHPCDGFFAAAIERVSSPAPIDISGQRS